MRLSVVGAAATLLLLVCSFEWTHHSFAWAFSVPSFATKTERTKWSLVADSTQQHQQQQQYPRLLLLSRMRATIEDTDTTSNAAAATTTYTVLKHVADSVPTAKEWGDMFGLDSHEVAFYALFAGLRKGAPLGLKGHPVVIRNTELVQALGDGDDGSEKHESSLAGYFTYDDLAKGVNDDFLDASRGSTDNRKGWKITSVSTPRGQSFEEARMTLEEVETALDKGTVIFNAAGAHIPKLARATLACTDATALPCAVNLYVTAPDKRTSAPPHTDRQDVVVVQTSGKKHWRVYSPPDPSLKPMADCYARGKGDDNMPLYAMETELGCKLLLETTLNVGDVLFVPAAFPHTTSTVNDDDDDETNANSKKEDTSIHLTFNFDTHVWDLDYLSARRLALRRACVVDSALGQSSEEDNRYEGKCNTLPTNVRNDLFGALPLGLLDDDDGDDEAALLDTTTAELERISQAVDATTASAVDPAIWRETLERLRQQGVELLDIHRDMYLASIEEGRTREAEDAMTAHLPPEQQHKTAMTPERMQRLSLFRVQRYYDKVNESKKTLTEWSYAGKPATTSTTTGAAESALPENWAFTLPLKVGDQVEADLGGALFPATVTRVVGDTCDVQFFDGDKESGLERGMIKLLTPPKAAGGSGDDVDTSRMTPKQLKRWKKKQQKKNKK